MKAFTKDELFLECKVEEIPTYWSKIYSSFNFNEIRNVYKSIADVSNFKKDIYYHYCNSFTEKITLNTKCILNQDIQEVSQNVENDNQKLNIIDTLMEIQDSTIVNGDAGIGKTFNLMVLASKMASARLAEQRKRVPIFIKGKLWGKIYSSLQEAVKYELEPFIPYISAAEIQKNLSNNKFIILIDAVDEVMLNLDLLLNDIMRYTKNNCLFIISSRPHASANLILYGFKKYNLMPLSDKSVSTYFEEVGKKKFFFYSRDIGESLRELIHYPLFLIMFVDLIQKNKDLKNLHNKALLYKRYIQNILNKILLAYDKKYSITTLEDLLGEVAYLMKNNVIEQNDISKIVNKVLGVVYIADIEQILIKSEIININDSIVSYFHPSFQEYFLSLFLNRKEDSELESFVSKNFNNKRYYPVFQFISGLQVKKKSQDKLLNFIESRNLILLLQCINSRHKFEKLSFIDDEDYIYRYFAQIRNSYLAIINSHFNIIKMFLFPWNLFENATDEICIDGRYNPETASISFRFIPKNGNKEISVEYLKGMPRIAPVGKKESKGIPVYSMRTNDGWHYYDLMSTGHGIDSAREIVLDVIKAQILSLLDKAFLPFGDSSAIQAEYIEKILNNIEIYKNKVKGLEEIPNLSLYENTINEIIESLAPYKHIVGINNINHFSPELNIQLAYLYLKDFKEKGITELDYLLPKENIKPQFDKNKKSFHRWELYTDEQLASRIKKYYDFFQSSYRMKIEHCFPTLKESFNLYKIEPVRYIITLIKVKRTNCFGGVVTEWEPVSELDDTKTILKSSDDYHEDFSMEYYNSLKHKLRKLNRECESIPGISNSILEIYFENEIITKNIYKKIKKEFESIFK